MSLQLLLLLLLLILNRNLQYYCMGWWPKQATYCGHCGQFVKDLPATKKIEKSFYFYCRFGVNKFKFAIPPIPLILSNTWQPVSVSARNIVWKKKKMRHKFCIYTLHSWGDILECSDTNSFIKCNANTDTLTHI